MRGKLIAIGVCVCCIAVVGLDARAQAVFLSNINQPVYGNGFSDPAYPVWQAFVTGPNVDGYSLNYVRMKVHEQQAGSGFAVVLAADSGGSPGATLATLSGPTPGSTITTNTYTANGYLMSPSTKYWIGMMASSGYYDWYYPTSTTFTVQDGWSYSTRLFYSVPQANSYFLEVAATPPDLNGSFYFQDFADSTNGAVAFADGSTLFSSALASASGIRDGTIKELQLTEKGVLSTRSAYMLPDLDPGTNVYAFSAKWNAIVDADFTLDFTPAGEGLSFNYGRLATLDLISASYNNEFGYGEGITVSFITSLLSGQPGFQVRAGGNLIAYVPADPSVIWGQNSNRRHLIEVDWHYRDGLSLRVDSATIFTNIPTYGFYPQRGSRFVWAARTSALDQQVRLDNIVVATRGKLVRESLTSPYFSQPGDLNPSSAFDNNEFTEWQTYTTTNVVIGGTLATQRNYRVYALTSANDIRGRDPRIWRLEGSVDGGTNWTVLDSRTGYFANVAETRMYLATNVQAYKQMRLNIVTNNGYANTFLAELRSYRFVPISDAPAPVARAAAGTNGHSLVVCSDDGRYAYTTTFPANNNIERSDDFGITWNFSGSPNQFFTLGLDCSDDGRHVISVGQSSRVQYSTNYGESFSQLNNSPLATFNTKLAISSNGSVMVMCLTNLAYSVNFGVNWTSTNLPNGGWRRATMSGDGQRIYAVSAIGVYSSTNFGAGWFTNNVSTTAGRDIACSRDGLKAVLAADSVLYVTSNGGASWTLTTVPGETRLFRAAACSSDGRRMFVLDQSVGRFRVYHSTDSGSTWTALFDDPGHDWRTMACSGDGQFLYIASASGCDTFHLLPKPPYVEDGYATDIGPFSATMVARIRPFGAPTRAFFGYGTTTNLGTTVNLYAGSSTGIESVTVSYPLTGLQTNTTYYFKPAATNSTGLIFGLGTNSSFTTLSLFGLDSWRYQYFGTTNNSGSAADTADPEGDSNFNLIEFASGTNPSVTNASPLFMIAASNGVPGIFYTKSVDAEGFVSWTIQSAADPINAFSDRSGSTQEVGSNGVQRTVRFDPDVPVTTNEVYLLKVTRQ